MFNEQKVLDSWWTEKDPYEGVFATISHIDESQEYRTQNNLHHLRLYSNRLATGLSGREYAIVDSGERLRLNVVRSVIDAACAQISSNRTRPDFLTIKGDYSLRKRAKNLNRFINGQFAACEQYRLGLDIFRDACIFGTGFEKIYEQGGQIYAERVFPDEIICDETESKYGSPRQLFQHKEINRDVAISSFPEHKDALQDAGLIRDGTVVNDNLSDPISIVEAWHLPAPGSDLKGTHDGRHVVACSSGTLVDEPYSRSYFPFASFRWSTGVLGYFGTGLAEEISSLQLEINYILQKIQALMNAATSQVWIKKGSGINANALNNMDWGVREYRDTPPTYINVAPVSPQYFEQLDRLYMRAYEIAGISQLSAQSKKPIGLNSGVALREFHSIETQRFAHVAQRWEDFYLDVAHQMVDCAREAAERGDGSLKVLAAGDKDVEMIKFNEVSIDRDKYSLRAYPTSLLPETPAGKLQTIKELAQVSPEIQRNLLPLLDMPDLEGINSLVNAPVEIVDAKIEGILDHGTYSPPTPHMDLNLALNRANLALLRAETENAPEDKLEMLRRWIDQTNIMLQSMQAPPMIPGQPPAEGAAPAQGGPVPPVAGMQLPPGLPQ